MFDRGDGRPLDPDALGAAFRRARERAKVSCRLHDLRHAYATRLVNAKTNARVVSDVMGHATVAFTLQTYYSPGDEEMANVAATIETAMGDTGRQAAGFGSASRLDNDPCPGGYVRSADIRSTAEPGEPRIRAALTG